MSNNDPCRVALTATEKQPFRRGNSREAQLLKRGAALAAVPCGQ